MTTRIEEFVAFLGWEVDDTDLKEFDDQVSGITETFKKVALAIGAASGALAAAIVVTNKETAELNNLAKTVGVTTEFLIGMGGVVSQIGLKTENVVDLVEELNNKFGEKAGLGKFSSVEDAVKILKLDFQEIKKLEPEKQFIRILDAAKNLEDQQQAVSAVDMLLGGEGNRIVGFLSTIEGSLDSIIGRRLELNFLSQEGIDQATSFNTLWGEASGVITSSWAQFAGLVGGAIKPLLDTFILWVRENRKLIKQKLSLWASDLGKEIMILFKRIKELFLTVKKLTDIFGGLGSSLKLLGLFAISMQIFKIVKAFTLLVPLIRGAAAATGLLKLALSALGTPAAVLAIALLILALDDLRGWFAGEETLFGAWGEQLADVLFEMTGDLDEFLGLQRGQLTRWLSDYVDMHVVAFNKVLKKLKFFFNNFMLISKLFAFRIGETISGIAKPFAAILDRLGGAPSAAGFAAQKQMKKEAEEALKLLNSAAKLAGPASLSAPSAAGMNTAAAAAAVSNPLGNAARQIENVANHFRGGSNRTDVRNNFQIQMRPGESGEDFARRVSEIMEEKMGTAVRNNDTGVVR